MRPVLKAGLRRVWRDETTLQIGLDPTRALVLADLAPPLTGVLDLLDGTRSRADVAATSAQADRLLTLLEDGGVLDDAGVDRGSLRALPGVERDRLLPDLTSLGLVEPAPGTALLRLARRQASRVRVSGAGRVGAHVAALLVAAGVGTVTVDDEGLVAAADVAPGGMRLDDVGRPRAAAATGVLARVAGSRPPRRSAGGPVRPDLVVLAPASLPVTDLDEPADLEREGIPHLVAGVREATGVVGPLVLPGLSACLLCQHLRRTDRDPAWPVLFAQLTHRREDAVACDVALAAVVAGVAACQALDLLDSRRERGTEADGEFPATVGGTLELALPDWRLRRRSWPVHLTCSCAAARLERSGGAA